MAEFNWSDLQQAAKDAGFSLIPKDFYIAEVVKAEALKTSTGKDQIKARFKVIEGPHAGAVVFTQFVISPESPVALGFFFRHMAGLGFNSDYFASNPPMEALAQEMVGRIASIKVDIGTFNEQERNEIKDVKPVRAGAPASSVNSSTPLPGNDVFAAPAPPAPAPAPVPQDAPAPPPLPSF